MKPPYIEGDMFSSLFEGATTFDLTVDKAEINGQVPAAAFEKPKK